MLHRRTACALALATLSAALFLACRAAPGESPRSSRPVTMPERYAINVAELDRAVGLEEAALRADLETRLVTLFGTPRDPRFRVLESWKQEGFDPNGWTPDGGGEHFEPSLRRSNAEAFAPALSLVLEGKPESIPELRYAPDLWDMLLSHTKQRPTTDDEAATEAWAANGAELILTYYPALRSSAVAFQRICSRCHGSSGGGDGMMAGRLRTRPRDYRPGMFKKTPLDGGARPRHRDLLRTLDEGIPGTAMPKFKDRLAPSILSGLADYVRFLSIRGETELLLIGDVDPDEGAAIEVALEDYLIVANRWRRSGEHLIDVAAPAPAPTGTRLARGRRLFLGKDGPNCAQCHGELGHGDGPAASTTDRESGESVPITDSWGRPTRPRDLVCHSFRFGGRPEDLYRRIHAGINGTPMPAHRDMWITGPDGTQRELDSDDIWDLVLFVFSLRTEEEH